jgi:hypothetical protein
MTTRMNLTAPIIRLLTWVRDNPNRQAADIEPLPLARGAVLRTAEQMQLVWWRGTGARGGWVLTDEGARQLQINAESTS